MSAQPQEKYRNWGLWKNEEKSKEAEEFVGTGNMTLNLELRDRLYADLKADIDEEMAKPLSAQESKIVSGSQPAAPTPTAKKPSARELAIAITRYKKKLRE